MAKQHKIRWSDKDTRELSRVVRNFNAKIKRLSKQNPAISNLLPEKVSAKELKQLINTRNDLKREISALERFSKRGAEKLVKVPKTENTYTTKWQKEELVRRVSLVNRRRKTRLNELSQLPAKSRGESLGYTVGQARDYIGMGRIREAELLPMSVFTASMEPRDIRTKYKSAMIQSQSDYFTQRDYAVRDNYIKGLLENYNSDDVADIIAKIQGMDIEDFLEIFYEEGATFEFASPVGSLSDTNKEAYELKQFEYEGYLESLKSTWL